MSSTRVVANDSHSLVMGYVAWVFGFMGAHRFYYGKPVSGTIYFFTLGLLGVGWVIDLFLIPSMDREADRSYKSGNINFDVAWLLLIFLGYLGAHRFYMGKLLTGLLWFVTGGMFGLGWLYDLWTLNEQISEVNTQNVLP
ncbi:MAG: TM2 domain-containing protein [Pseudobdellovibrionaceae bacterium]|nr:TM2 domain-containing protein [Bdellovibrionales bacterium]USN46137.1 MAG: TM2 domain-containing protein [Pseudobdellovibrionaceae bacterium]